VKLEDIGFYTLSDERTQNLSPTSPMWRCEMILTDRCNFRCPYCRGLRDDCVGDMPYEKAFKTLATWCDQGLKNIRFSGGEPMLYGDLPKLVAAAKMMGVEHIAISTNGSFPLEDYLYLIECGVNDFSISFDACCGSDFGELSGLNTGLPFTKLCNNIEALSALAHVTVGVVLTDANLPNLQEIVTLAHDLGVADIRIIPAAQNGKMIEGVEKIPGAVLDRHPILAYRVANLLGGVPVRSIVPCDSPRCFIPIDDSVACGDFHFPCIIYMREQGEPIGRLGPNMRQERIEWSKNHNTHTDPICKANCLDVCTAHNNKCHYAALDRGE
jgi:pyruvate-formate lyase-activating enzyme